MINGRIHASSGTLRVYAHALPSDPGDLTFVDFGLRVGSVPTARTAPTAPRPDRDTVVSGDDARNLSESRGNTGAPGGITPTLRFEASFMRIPPTSRIVDLVRGCGLKVLARIRQRPSLYGVVGRFGCTMAARIPGQQARLRQAASGCNRYGPRRPSRFWQRQIAYLAGELLRLVRRKRHRPWEPGGFVSDSLAPMASTAMCLVRAWVGTIRSCARGTW